MSEYAHEGDQTLADIVIASLEKIGLDNIKRIVPQFNYKAGIYAICSVLLDSNNIIYKGKPLVSFYRFVRAQAGRTVYWPSDDAQLELQLSLSKAELVFVPRTSAVGIVLAYNVSKELVLRVVDGHDTIALECDTTTSKEFVPLIGLSIRSNVGRLAEWLDELALAQPNQDRNVAQTEALRQFLALWTVIIRTWIHDSVVIQLSELAADCENTTKKSTPKQNPRVLDSFFQQTKRQRSPEPTYPTYSRPKKKLRSAFNVQVWKQLSADLIAKKIAHWPTPIRNLAEALPRLPVIPGGTGLDLMYTVDEKYLTTSFSMGSTMRRMETSAARISCFDIDVGTTRLVKWPANLQVFRPTFPGAPGIIFDWPDTSNLLVPYDNAYTVFSEIEVEVEVVVDGQMQKQIQGNRWRYCGEYKLEVCSQKDLGRYLTTETIQRWSEWILERVEKAEVYRFIEGLTELGLRYAGLQDVDNAIWSGKLPLTACTLRCIKYHPEIQDRLVSSTKFQPMASNDSPTSHPPPQVIHPVSAPVLNPIPTFVSDQRQRQIHSLPSRPHSIPVSAVFEI